jgi:hypothetical protein
MRFFRECLVSCCEDIAIFMPRQRNLWVTGAAERPRRDRLAQKASPLRDVPSGAIQAGWRFPASIPTRREPPVLHVGVSPFLQKRSIVGRNFVGLIDDDHVELSLGLF